MDNKSSTLYYLCPPDLEADRSLPQPKTSITREVGLRISAGNNGSIIDFKQLFEERMQVWTIYFFIELKSLTERYPKSGYSCCIQLHFGKGPINLNKKVKYKLIGLSKGDIEHDIVCC